MLVQVIKYDFLYLIYNYKNYMKKEENKFCLNCGELIKKQNKFCNNSCAASYNNKKRKLTEETKNKIKISLLGIKRVLERSRGRKTTLVCENCKKEYKVLIFRINESGSKYCSVKCYNEYRRNNSGDSKHLIKLNQIKSKYGLNETEYKSLFEKQDNKCAICGLDLDNIKTCVDHNHKTGEVRGILCDKCNKGIGHFNDDINLFENIILYLKKFKTN
jgi:nitrate/TMAO reductase-like tetraheme cytochrome c subunit